MPTISNIETERLLLRPLRPGDAEPLFELFADWEVIRWLSMPPWQYGAEADGFQPMTRPAEAECHTTS